MQDREALTKSVIETVWKLQHALYLKDAEAFDRAVAVLRETVRADEPPTAQRAAS